MLSEGPLDHLDHAPTRQFYGGKIGIDATHKGPAEGTREWPEEIVMSDEIRALVDRRWAEYGIGADAERQTDRTALVAAIATSLTFFGEAEKVSAAKRREPMAGVVAARCANCYVVDAGSQGPIESAPRRGSARRSRHSARADADHLAGRLRRWHRLHLRRPDPRARSSSPSAPSLAAIFGFLWIRDVDEAVPREEAPAERRAAAGSAAATREPRAGGPEPGEGEIVRYPRSKFLEATTLGLGALIGVIVTAPVLGFTILPPFIKQGHPKIDVGAIDDFPENKFVIATFLLKPGGGRGLAADRVHPQQRLPRRESRASRSSPTAASISAARSR